MTPHTLIFFSSSPIAIPLFETLVSDARFSITALICQPDKAAGRQLELTVPEIKKRALHAGIPVYQPEKLSQDAKLLDELKKNPPEILLTFSYGQFLSEDWLALPLFAPLNIHPSLLPRYRGPTPIQTAILNGDKETGITVMKMGKGMDDGPIAFQEKISIEPHQSSQILFESIAQRCAQIVPDALAKIFEQGASAFVEQDSAQATICKLIRREDGLIDFKEPATTLLNRFRAYTPWPGLYTTYQGKRLKLLDFSVASLALEPGMVRYENHHLFIGTSDGALDVRLLQLEGRSTLHPEAFIAGQGGFHGTSLPS